LDQLEFPVGSVKNTHIVLIFRKIDLFILEGWITCFRE